MQIRERALGFNMRAANELMTEVWNEDTTAFPFTGGSKLDPAQCTPGQTLTLGPLYYKWLTSNGKEGVEPTEPLERIMQLIDTARTVGHDGQVQAAQEVVPHLGGQCVRDQCGWADADGPRRRGGQRKMHNVPTTIGNDWPLRTPGNARTEQFFFRQVMPIDAKIDASAPRPRRTGPPPPKGTGSGRHPQLCRLREGKSWIPAFAGMTRGSPKSPLIRTAWYDPLHRSAPAASALPAAGLLIRDIRNYPCAAWRFPDGVRGHTVGDRHLDQH